MLKIKTPDDTLEKIGGIRIKTDDNLLAKVGKCYQVIDKDGKSALSLIFSSKCKHIYENTGYEPPSCNTTENWVYTCIKCGDVKYEYGESASGEYHNYEIVTDGETGLKMWKCIHCDDSFPVVDDDEEGVEHECEYEIVDDEETGEQMWVCIHCGNNFPVV